MALGIPEIPGNSHRFPLIPIDSRELYGSLSTRFALDNTLIPNKKQEALALTQARVIHIYSVQDSSVFLSLLLRQVK
jgi:hypothetical protein